MPPEEIPPPQPPFDEDASSGTGGPSASDIAAMLEYIKNFTFGNDGDYTGNGGYGGDNIGPPGSKEPEREVDHSRNLLDILLAPPGMLPGALPRRGHEVDVYSGVRAGFENPDPFTGLPASDPFRESEPQARWWTAAPFAALRAKSLLSSPHLLAENDAITCNPNRATCMPPVKSDFNQSSLANEIQADIDPSNVAVQAILEGKVKIVGKTEVDMHKIASKAVAIAGSDQYKRSAALSNAVNSQRNYLTPRSGPPSSQPGVAPHWTTQTEWTYPRPDSRLIQPVTYYDSGNTTFNFLANKIVLPWRNVLAFYENIALATFMGIDDALKNNPTWSSTYQAAQDMLPLSRTMGLAMEVGPALNFASAWMSSLGRAPAMANVPTLPARAVVSIGDLGRVGQITSKPTFRQFVTAAIRDPQHPLHGLLNPETGRLTPSTTKGLTELHWFEDPRIVEAGHWSSAKDLRGTPDRLVIMSAYENRLASAVIEHPSIGGIMKESGHVVSIGGLPVDLRTAEALVEFGVLDAEVLANAPIILF